VSSYFDQYLEEEESDWAFLAEVEVGHLLFSLWHDGMDIMVMKDEEEFQLFRLSPQPPEEGQVARASAKVANWLYQFPFPGDNTIVLEDEGESKWEREEL
jgi:hypothetical protein